MFHKLVVVGVADGLWLVHRDKLEDPVTADMAVVHFYAYQPQTKAFLKVDSAPIPDSYILVQSVTPVPPRSASTIQQKRPIGGLTMW